MKEKLILNFNKKLRLFFIFLLLIAGSFLAVKQIKAANYTVCSSGCTATNISGVISGNVLGPGDTISVADGTYAEIVTVTNTDDGDVTGVVLFQETAGSVLLDAQVDKLRSLRLNGSSYVTVDGWNFFNGTAQNFYIHGAGSHNTITNFIATDAAVQACYIDDQTDFLISSGIITGAEGDGIYILDTASGSLTDLSISNSGDDGIDCSTTGTIIFDSVAIDTTTNVGIKINDTPFAFTGENSINNAGTTGISILSGPATGSIQDMEISGSGTNGIVVSGTGEISYTDLNIVHAGTSHMFWISSGGPSILERVSINGLGSAVTSNGLYLETLTGSFSASDTIEVMNAGNHGVYFSATNQSITLDDVYSGTDKATGSDNGNSNTGFYFGNTTGTLQLNELTSKYNDEEGFYFVGIGSVGDGSYLRNFYAGYNGNSGMKVSTGTAPIISDGVLEYCQNDGFAANDSISHSVMRVVSRHNGIDGDDNSGDGITSHGNGTGGEYSYWLIYKNGKSGVALDTTGSHKFYNIAMYRNADDDLTYNQGEFAVLTSPDEGDELVNNILMNNDESLSGSDRLLININSFSDMNTLDYNCYYSVNESDAVFLVDDQNGGSPMTWSQYISVANTAGFELHSQYANPQFLNTSGNMEEVGDYTLLPTSPAIDAGTDVSLTTDYAGNPIYGTPDIGAYEYQPPYTMGINEIDISEGARTYGDEQFRDLGERAGATADLSVAIPASDKNKWLDITISEWEISGTYSKAWNENTTASGITNTVHTVGDLNPSTYYNVTVDDGTDDLSGDDCDTVGANFVCLSNGSGEISFTYAGTYSDHDFEVETNDSTPPTLSSGSPSGTLSVNTSQTTLSLTTSESSTCKYGTTPDTAYAGIANTFGTTGGTTHSQTITSLQNGTTYNYYVRCQDTTGNPTTSDYTISFSVAPEENDSTSVSSPKIKIGNNETELKDKKAYASEEKFKFKGKDADLANGSLIIKRDGKSWKTIDIDSQGLWKTTVKLLNGKKDLFKFKFYDQYGTLVGTSKKTLIGDTEKPQFVSFIRNLTIVTPEVTTLTWTATDDQKIKKYKIYLGGRIYNTKYNSFQVPREAPRGLEKIRIRAYDEAGNHEDKEAWVRVR